MWTGPVMCALIAGGLFTAGMLPPTLPSAGAEQIADHFRNDQLGIRIGCVLLCCGFALMGAWGPTVAMWTGRTEGRFPVTSYVQLVCVAASVAQTICCPILWAVAAFRPEELGDQSTRMLNDLGWFFIIFNAPIVEVWVVAVAVAVLRDKSAAPALPRWIGFLSLWTALLNIPAVGIAFFKTGPLAYDGMFAFYLPFVVFGTWLAGLTYVMLKHISALERQAASSVTDVGAPHDGDLTSGFSEAVAIPGPSNRRDPPATAAPVTVDGSDRRQPDGHG